ncbi:MAG TPA: hypothetical protein VMU76_04530 [Acidimicrobiales bacterium]|nr:hypothetical protein [Acidimicrobiales bacterium]
MEVKGILFATLDIPAEYTAEYNRWYDLDHLPEHISKGDVVTARRYVAPRDLQAAPGAVAGELTGGHPPYATIYFFGLEAFDGPEALGFWTTKDRGIVKAGRYWQQGRGTYSGRWRLAETFTGPGVLVSPAAVPYLAHRGMIVAIGRAPSPERREEAVAWWRETQVVDLLAVPGVLAAIRFDPVAGAAGDLTMHVLLCGDDPADVMPRIEGSRRTLRATGRYPAHGGVYEPLAFLPYRTIVPFEYDFDFGLQPEGTSVEA